MEVVKLLSTYTTKTTDFISLLYAQSNNGSSCIILNEILRGNKLLEKREDSKL